MRRRPWPIVLLAIFQLVAPVYNLVSSAWLLKVSPFQLLGMMFDFYSWSRLLDFFGLPLIAGFAIFAMRRWSYPVFFSICAWSLHQNVDDWFSFQSPYKLGLVVASFFLNIGFVAYFLIPSVRIAYFDPRLRWWESKPRFKVKISGELKWSGGRGTFRGLDLSEGGMFIQVPARTRLIVGDEVAVSFTFFNFMLSLLGRVVHTAKIGVPGYGIQFIHAGDESRRRLRRLTRALELLEFEKRLVANDWRSDLKEWAATLIRTGKGVVPDLPVRAQVPETPGALKRRRRAVLTSVASARPARRKPPKAA